MGNFCYWQENSPIGNSENYFNFLGKICLLHLNEYKLQKELNLTEKEEKINIFCPYKNKEDALCCINYSLIKDIK